MVKGGVKRARDRCAAELAKGNYFAGCPVQSKRYKDRVTPSPSCFGDRHYGGNMSKNRQSRFTTCSTLFVSIFIVIVAAADALTAQSATQAAQPPAPQIAPTLVPSHVVDLMTEQGIAVFRGQWKTMEAKIVEGPALPNAMPGYKTSYDVMPHAGEAGFNDSSWPTIEPKR